MVVKAVIIVVAMVVHLDVQEIATVSVGIFVLIIAELIVKVHVQADVVLSVMEDVLLSVLVGLTQVHAPVDLADVLLHV